MEPIQILSLIWANKETIVAFMGTVHVAASTLAQHTGNTKDDTVAARFGSLVDLLAGAVGKASPNEAFARDEKFRTLKDAGRLAKHIATGKYK